MPDKSLTPTPELLPCPFCAGKPVLVDDSGPLLVECEVCRAASGRAPCANKAIQFWNRRTPPAAIKESLMVQPAHLDPGHRLTEAEMDTAEKIYNDIRRGRSGDVTTGRAALEAVIRGFLSSIAPQAPASTSGSEPLLTGEDAWNDGIGGEE